MSKIKRQMLLFFIVVGAIAAPFFLSNYKALSERNGMKFIEVARCFDAIEPIAARLEITRLLADLFRNASDQEAEIVASLSLGQLHPPYIGTHFNVAEKNLIKAVADFLKRPQEDIVKEMKQAGDLGLVIGSYQWSSNEELSVMDVYQALCAIEKVGGSGSQDQKIKDLSHLFSQLDPLSAKFVARIVLGKLRLGFSDMTIIDALSWMEAGDKSLRTIVEDAYNVCADIGLIAHTIKQGGIEAIKKMHIAVGIPIIPAAAERLPTAQAIYEKLGHCFAEPKLDGFRLQIHIDKTNKEQPVVRFFSRNLQDMSAMFPDLARAFLNLEVTTLICEGEAIGYDPSTHEFLPFQETIKRKRKHGIEEAAAEFPLKVFLFDLLYLNGQEYLNVGYIERHKELQRMLSFSASPLIAVNEYKAISDPQALKDYFYETVSLGLEGLVVKRADAIYQPGKRNFNWIKLKRQEEGHLEDTLDCVVLGYYSGEGKRAHFGIGAFLVGIYNKQVDMFQTIAKIGTGMTDAEWKTLKATCDAIAMKEQPKNVICAKELMPDVWVTPTVVCRVRADEITLSPLHAAGKTEQQLGYALRFPRFMDYRTDKSAEEATTDQEIKRLYEDQFVR